MKKIVLVLLFAMPLGICAQPSPLDDPRLQDSIRQAALLAKNPNDFSRQLALATALRNQLFDAAYSGDIDFLEKNCDISKTNVIATPSPAELVGEALAGHQYDAIKWCADKDPDAKTLSGWFSSKQMDLKAAKSVFDEVPALKTNFCNRSLDGTILTDNTNVLKFLLESGVKPANESRPPAPLLLAAQLRRIEAISLLIKNGADPYKKTPEGFSPVDYAINIRSSTILKALDRDKKYLTDLTQIGNELHPFRNSSFVGTWADLHEGFGSLSITLYSDGTGTMGSDIGGMPCILKSSGGQMKMLLFKGQAGFGMVPDESQSADLKIEGKDLVLVMDGEEHHLMPCDPKAPTEASTIQRPYYLRVENVCLSPANELFIQINGCFNKISIDELAKAQSPSDDEKTPSNEFANKMFRWSNFQKGQIPKNIIVKSKEVAFVDNHTDGYFQDKLAFDFTHDATLKDGFDFTLFPYGGNEYYHGPDTNKFGEHLDGYALLSKTPFSNGKNWLVFYVLKTASSDLPRPSPW